MSAIKWDLRPCAEAGQLEQVMEEMFGYKHLDLRTLLADDNYQNDCSKEIDILDVQGVKNDYVEKLRSGELVYVPEWARNKYHRWLFDARDGELPEELKGYENALRSYSYFDKSLEDALFDKEVMDRLVDLLQELHPSPVWVIDMSW